MQSMVREVIAYYPWMCAHLRRLDLQVFISVKGGDHGERCS